MMPHPLLSAVLSTLAALQTPGEAPSAPTPKWIEIDRVVAIVNQDVVTLRQLQRELRAWQARNQASDESQRQRAQSEILTARVKQLLGKQAGQDMGADEKLVERNVKDRFEMLVSNFNGTVGMSKVLQNQDLTADEWKKGLREQLYGSLWQDTVTGESPGLSERSARDRYVRPGQLRFRYVRALREPQTLNDLGGALETVTLQKLTLDVKANGGQDATMALARQCKQSIEDGSADMSELVRKYGKDKLNDGVDLPLPVSGLREILPAMARFVDARPADTSRWPTYVSQPFVFGQYEAVQIVRIQEFTPARLPDLGDSVTQRAVTRLVRDDLDDYRLEHAFARLYDAAYVWPPEYASKNKH